MDASQLVSKLTSQPSAFTAKQVRSLLKDTCADYMTTAAIDNARRRANTGYKSSIFVHRVFLTLAVVFTVSFLFTSNDYILLWDFVSMVFAFILLEISGRFKSTLLKLAPCDGESCNYVIDLCRRFSYADDC